MISSCLSDVWSPMIGDPHPMGWVIFFCYFLTAVLAGFVVLRARQFTAGTGDATNQYFWTFVLLLLLFLGINKQLDLQSFLTAIAKCVAISEGWYADRREYQAIFVIIISVLFLVFSVFCIWKLRNDLKKNLLAVLGVLFLLFFIIVRASSFHKFNLTITDYFHGVGASWLLELWGIFLIFLQSAAHLLKPEKIAENGSQSNSKDLERRS